MNQEYAKDDVNLDQRIREHRLASLYANLLYSIGFITIGLSFADMLLHITGEAGFTWGDEFLRYYGTLPFHWLVCAVDEHSTFLEIAFSIPSLIVYYVVSLFLFFRFGIVLGRLHARYLSPSRLQG